VRPVAKPPAQPPSTIGVKHMAVMAGLYKAESGLRNLPEAEAEAKALAKSYQAVALAANLTDVKRMLDAKLSQEFNEIGGVEAIHFAGHGDFDQSQTDSSVLMLSEGRPLPSIMFRSANYGGEKQPQPLFFLNGCMIGGFLNCSAAWAAPQLPEGQPAESSARCDRRQGRTPDRARVLAAGAGRRRQAGTGRRDPARPAGEVFGGRGRAGVHVPRLCLLRAPAADVAARAIRREASNGSAASRFDPVDRAGRRLRDSRAGRDRQRGTQAPAQRD
jgi:hypothetical protein